MLQSNAIYTNEGERGHVFDVDARERWVEKNKTHASLYIILYHNILDGEPEITTWPTNNHAKRRRKFNTAEGDQKD